MCCGVKRQETCCCSCGWLRIFTWYRCRASCSSFSSLTKDGGAGGDDAEADRASVDEGELRGTRETATEEEALLTRESLYRSIHAPASPERSADATARSIFLRAARRARKTFRWEAALTPSPCPSRSAASSSSSSSARSSASPSTSSASPFESFWPCFSALNSRLSKRVAVSYEPLDVVVTVLSADKEEAAAAAEVA